MAITVQETFTLPSKGKLYSQDIPEKVLLRSMTTEDEMARLSPSEGEYDVICRTIDDCIVGDFPISSYDMCLGDYQYLLTKLQLVSYGKEYKTVMQCPNCNDVVRATVNLDEIEVFTFDEENPPETTFELPVSKKKVTLSFQTPRMLDAIKEKAKKKRRETKTNHNFELMYSAMSLISAVDGKEMNEMNLETFVKKLPVKDVYFIINKGDELNGKVGLDNSVIAKCSNCNYQVVTKFRLEPKFFGPQND